MPMVYQLVSGRFASLEPRSLRSEASGLPHWDERIPMETIYDTKASTDLLAAQAPWFKAGFNGFPLMRRTISPIKCPWSISW
jgi:hypothetical protein